MRVLHLYCGEGRLSLKLKERGYHVTGVDPSVQAICKAIQMRYVDDGFVGDPSRIRFPLETFDGIACPSSMLPNEEIWQIIKPGGQILLLGRFWPLVWLKSWLLRFTLRRNRSKNIIIKYHV